METAGAILRRLRKEKGLTLEQVAARTRIRSEILREIEEDNYRQVAGGPFLQGFIKSYARALGQSDSEIANILASVEEVAPSVKPGLAPPAAPRKSSWLGYGVVAVLVVASILVMVMLRKDKAVAPVPVVTQAPQPPAEPAVPPVAQPPVPSIPPAPAPLAAKPKTEPVPAPTPAAPAAPAIPGVVPSEPSARPPDVAKDEAAPPEPQKTISVRLTIKATESCWLRGLIDGATQKDILLGAGESVHWEAQENMRITIGNAGGVILVVNGKEYKDLGVTGQVLSGIVVTKDGINPEQIKVR